LRIGSYSRNKLQPSDFEKGSKVGWKAEGRVDMGLRDWIRNRGKARSAPEPEDEPAGDRYVTKRGNPIKVIQQGKWHSDYPGYESKMLIGRSIEGYHGG
jgi:hypothetical protein